MREVGVLEAKTRLSELLDGVEAGGDDVTITRRGKPIARLTAPKTSSESDRLMSGPELVEHFRALRERISAASPDTDNLTWAELKRMARE